MRAAPRHAWIPWSSGYVGIRRVVLCGRSAVEAGPAVLGSRRFLSVRSTAELFTSPAGLMALLYKRSGGSSSSTSSGSGDGEKRMPLPRSRRHRRQRGTSDKSNNNDNGKDGTGPSAERESSIFSKEAVRLAVIILVLSALWELFNSQRSNISQKLRNCFMITLEVRSSQEECAMIMDWMGRQPRGQRGRNIALRPVTVLDERKLQHTSGGISDEEERVTFVPGYGTHFFTFEGTWMWVTRREDQSKQKSSMRVTGTDRENDVLVITLLTRKREVASAFLSSVRESWEVNVRNKVRIFVGEVYSSMPWVLLTERARRPLDTLYLPEAVMEVVSEVRSFLALRDTYAALGIPWRRGYLFEGVPGTGKSSFVTALAGELNLPVHLLSLQAEGMSDDALIQLVSKLPQRCILLIEDIESGIKNPNGASRSGGGEQTRSCTELGGSSESGVTISGLLNALDGLSSSEGRVLVVTSNDPRKIPFADAMLRPGRIDRRVSFDPLKPQEMSQMAASFAKVLRQSPETSLSQQQQQKESGELPASVKDDVAKAAAAAAEELIVSGTTMTPAGLQQQLLGALYHSIRDAEVTAR